MKINLNEEDIMIISLALSTLETRALETRVSQVESGDYSGFSESVIEKRCRYLNQLFREG